MEDDPDLAALLEQKRLLEAQLKHDLQFEFGQPDSDQFPPTQPPLSDDSRKRRANADSQASSLPSTPDSKRHRRMAVDFGDDDGQLGASAITSTPGSELSESPIRTPTRLSDNSGHSDSLLLSELVGGCPHGAVDLHRSLERLTDTSIEEKDLTPTPSKAPSTANTLRPSLSESSSSSGEISSSSEDEDDFVSVCDNGEERDAEMSADGLDVDELLEKPFENGTNPSASKGQHPANAEFREKVVLENRGTEYFDVLPDGWIEVTHKSGLPVFLQKATRVCTFSRPYFLGPGSVRNHPVPISAIPCMHQQRIKEELQSAAAAADAVSAAGVDVLPKDGEDKSDRTKAALAKLGAPGARVQTAEDFRLRQLAPEQLQDYAKSVFQFKTIKVYRFSKWATTRSYHKQRKQAEAERQGQSSKFELGRPSLPANVKLITVPSLDKNTKPQQKAFFLNPQGKTSVGILHEYVQKVLKSTIKYTYVETRNASEPYGCTAKLKTIPPHRDKGGTIKERLMRLQQQRHTETNGDGPAKEDEDYVTLGSGFGNSKKGAKIESAKRALEVLIPGVEFDEDGVAATSAPGGSAEDDAAVAFFDMLPMEDSRVPEMSAKAGQPTPYLILQECLKRNAAFGDTEIRLNTKRLKHQKHQFDMSVGKHEVSVVCTNKKEGKQKASQAMLKKLHPQIDTWGSLIRLYGHAAQRKLHETRKKKESIIKLQGAKNGDSSVEPNLAILDKLRKEMDLLYRKNDQGRLPTDADAVVGGARIVANIDI